MKLFCYKLALPKKWNKESLGEEKEKKKSTFCSLEDVQLWDKGGHSGDLVQAQG